ncbi:MAG: FAD-binding oxidoreductase [Chloroflexi bacterium]|nr:FAD-binding oxidoreductase [Chloroflexota bacterium]
MNHSLDGLSPSKLERPKNLAELSKVLADANGTGAAVIPWGGGTRIGVGNVPSKYDIALDLTGHTEHLEHVAGDMTVIVDSGVRVIDLSSALEREGQRLPFEVRNPEQATIGGSVASNGPGRRQSSAGGIRDWVIGMQIVLADGTITKSGGRVVKNVQGYDLHRLHTGAFGTLGVISQIAFKLVPLPPEQQTVLAWFDDSVSANEVGMRLVNGSFAPEGISLTYGPLAAEVVKSSGEISSTANDIKWALLVRLSGGVRSIERQVNEVTGSAGAGGATGYAVLDHDGGKNAWSRLELAESAASTVARITGRTVDTIKIVETLSSDPADIAHRISTINDLGFGAITALAGGSTDHEAKGMVDTVIRHSKQVNGSYTIEKCPLSVKREIDVFSDVGSSIEVMRRIKTEYDPSNTLNPGRFVGKI